MTLTFRCQFTEGDILETKRMGGGTKKKTTIKMEAVAEQN